MPWREGGQWQRNKDQGALIEGKEIWGTVADTEKVTVRDGEDRDSEVTDLEDSDR